MKAYFFILIVVFLGSCVSQKWCNNHYPPISKSDTIIKDSVTVCYRDSVIEIPADSSALQALIDCRGQLPRLYEILHYQAGKRINVPVIRLRHDTITIQCRTDSGSVAFSWAEKNRYKLIKINSQAVQKVNYLTGWQQFLKVSGYIFWGIILLFVVIIILKLILKVNIPFLKV